MTSFLTKKERNKAIDMLFIARMQHTRWVAEIKKQQVPAVEKDPTKCEFGRWLLESRKSLHEFDAYRALEAPHTELHDAYKRLLTDPKNQAERDRIIEFSNILIDNIDRLEKELKRAEVAHFKS